MAYYIMDGRHVRRVGLAKWALWMESAERILKQVEALPGVLVSTVFLGIDYRTGEGPPLLFETMIFGGAHDQSCWRYSTWEEAMAGHLSAVEGVVEGRFLAEEAVEDLVGMLGAAVNQEVYEEAALIRDELARRAGKSTEPEG